MCPIWPGGPVKVHWGVEDPGSLAESKPEEEGIAVFQTVADKLEQRIRRFLELPLHQRDLPSLKAELDRIGQTG